MAQLQQDLELWLHGWLQKHLAQLGDPGEVVKAQVDRPDSDTVAEVDGDRRWVAVWVKSLVDGRRRFLVRLLSPGGMLWWMPEKDEVGAMLRAGNLTGALTAYFLSGHGGAPNRVPSWLSSTVVGLFARAGKTLRLDAEDGDLEATAGGKVKLQGGGRRAAGEGHSVDMGTFTLNGVGNAFTGITWTPPGGGVPITFGAATPTALTGAIDEGSDKVEIDS